MLNRLRFSASDDRVLQFDPMTVERLNRKQFDEAEI